MVYDVLNNPELIAESIKMEICNYWTKTVYGDCSVDVIPNGDIYEVTLTFSSVLYEATATFTFSDIVDDSENYLESDNLTLAAQVDVGKFIIPQVDVTEDITDFSHLVADMDATQSRIYSELHISYVLGKYTFVVISDF